jgi:hypothetical protein
MKASANRRRAKRAPSQAKRLSKSLAAEQLLFEVQRRAVLFFWAKCDPVTGLINDRANNFEDDSYTLASCAATGYGLAALAIAVEHGWIDRTAASDRARRTLRFLLSMQHVHGWMPHFIDRRDGTLAKGTEYSSIDTALLVIGALVCGRYFAADSATSDIEELSNELYCRLDWPWILTNDMQEPDKTIVSHGWRPESGFIPYNYGEYSEAMLLYLLGLGAAKDPLPAETWDSIKRPLQNYGAIESLRAGPIFIHQMPSGFFPLRNQRDRLGFDYWVSSTNAMQIHRQFCLHQAASNQTYAQGFWGLNAGDGPDGYHAYGAPDGPEDGTVSPTGAIAAITFTPELAISAALACYQSQGSKLWGKYGFSNAFNLALDWYDPDVIGIDLGMALLAIENYRSGLIWSLVSSTEFVKAAFRKAGFQPTVEPEPRPVWLPTPLRITTESTENTEKGTG